jgi:hypothetical protein
VRFKLNYLKILKRVKLAMPETAKTTVQVSETSPTTKMSEMDKT